MSGLDQPQAAVDELVAYTQIRRLQNRYADVVTRQAWAELHDIMQPDCVLDLELVDRHLTLTGPGAIGEFIGTSLEQFTFFEFAILNTVVQTDLDRGRAAARMYMQELRQTVEGGRRSDAFGVYHDLFVATDTGWRFARRWYASYSRTAPPGADADQLVFDLPVRALDVVLGAEYPSV